jgi:ERCC4-type nuclease
MLISPTERPPFPSLGTVSSVPEKFGVDFLMYSPVFGTVGVQRKEINDLVASLSDGRVSREIIDMKGLDVGIWLIEGTPMWSGEGQLMSARVEFTKTSFAGVMLSLMSQGYWTVTTISTQESMSWLSTCEKWMAKTSHKGFTSRPNPPSTSNLTDQRIWVLQGFKGLGHDRARDIVGHYRGLPFRFRDGVDLRQVAGIGDKTAAQIEKVIG